MSAATGQTPDASVATPADTEDGSVDGAAFCGATTVAITGRFRRFHQSDDMFCRGFWDPKVANRMTRRFFRSFVKPAERFRDEDGFGQRDYALRNGPWVVTEMFAEMKKGEDRRDGFWDDFSAHIPPDVPPRPIDDIGAAAEEIKRVARIYGADLVGITDYDERFTYGSSFSARGGGAACKPIALPDGLTNVVVIGKAMDLDLIRTSPSATASAAPAIGYAHDAVLLLALAQYIRSLGYQAVACQNDTTLAVPYAIKAGLGEYGRHGLVISKAYGPRIRLGRVITDMPLAHDAPVAFGVAETCEICRRCANNCPPQAIDHGPPSTYRFNRSNIAGVRKWTTDGEKCFKFWVARGTDCANCIRTCPYNKDFLRWHNRLLRWALGTRLRRLALRLDDLTRRHDRFAPSGWWHGRPAGWRRVERAADAPIDPERVANQERVKAMREDGRREALADADTPKRETAAADKAA